MKKIVLTVVFASIASCHGLSLEGDYSVEAPKKSSIGLATGAIVGAGTAFGATFFGSRLIKHPLHLRGDDKLKGIIGLSGATLLGGALGGFVGYYIDSLKTDNGYEVYQAELKAVLEVAGSEVVTISLEDFGAFVEEKGEELVAEEIDTVLEVLAKACIEIEALINETSEKTDEWNVLFHEKTKSLLDDITLIVNDLLAKKEFIEALAIEEAVIEEVEEPVVEIEVVEEIVPEEEVIEEQKEIVVEEPEVEEIVIEEKPVVEIEVVEEEPVEIEEIVLEEELKEEVVEEEFEMARPMSRPRSVNPTPSPDRVRSIEFVE